MKIFISWSGKGSISEQVANTLFKWLPMIVQSIEPWLSTEITSGDKWNETIDKNLLEAQMGIICVTKENINAPWLNFEAGAIAKGVSSNKVIPLLIDLKPSDLSKSPLSHYQAISLEKTSMQELLIDINSLSERKIEESRLVELFNFCWDDFNKKINGIFSQVPKKIEKEKVTRPSEEILEEVLSLTREVRNELSFRMERLEKRNENRNEELYNNCIKNELKKLTINNETEENIRNMRPSDELYKGTLEFTQSNLEKMVSRVIRMKKQGMILSDIKLFLSNEYGLSDDIIESILKIAG